MLRDNPLYEYLMDLQERRVRLADALAPRRHTGFHLWLSLIMIALWVADACFPPVAGLPMAIFVLAGPLVVVAGPYIAGARAQQIAVQNYPSPLDSPLALELLLTTPLSEKEIVSGTLGALLRYPFIGASFRRLLMPAASFAIWAAAVLSGYLRGTLPVEMLVIAANLYLPAACVFVFFPLLSALDQLIIPPDWIRSAEHNQPSRSENLFGRSGRFPILATILSLAPVMAQVIRKGSSELSTLRWTVATACPVIFCSIGIACVVVSLFLPAYLARLRRS